MTLKVEFNYTQFLDGIKNKGLLSWFMTFFVFLTR